MLARTPKRPRTVDARESPRIVLYAPHFAEYAMRLAEALSAEARVMLVVEKRNLANECAAGLRRRIAPKITLLTFDASSTMPPALFRRYCWLPLRIRRFRPAIAHVQEQADARTAGLVEWLGRRMPVVLTVHDPQPHSGADKAYAEQGRAYLDRLRGAADGLHVHGPFCEAQLRATRRVERPLVSTPLGVLLAPEPGALREPDSGRLLFFGRMEAYKGLETLLDAVAALRGRGRVFTLTIAGRGPELDRLADRIAASPDITLIDRFLAPEEATALFQQSAIVLAPYLDATQSGIVAAAFGNGRPVVASRVGGLVDAVADATNGVLVPPNDPEALAEALDRLLTDDRALAALRRGARARAETDLDWSRIAGGLAAFYRDIVAATEKSSRATGAARGTAFARRTT